MQSCACLLLLVQGDQAMLLTAHRDAPHASAVYGLQCVPSGCLDARDPLGRILFGPSRSCWIDSQGQEEVLPARHYGI